MYICMYGVYAVYAVYVRCLDQVVGFCRSQGPQMCHIVGPQNQQDVWLRRCMMMIRPEDSVSSLALTCSHGTTSTGSTAAAI
jgi:hypothetical protein